MSADETDPCGDPNKVHPDMWLLCWGLGLVILYGLYQAWEIWINSPPSPR